MSEGSVTRMIHQDHCQQCGSTDREDIDMTANDGYSACCNEVVVFGGACEAGYCGHLEGRS